MDAHIQEAVDVMEQARLRLVQQDQQITDLRARVRQLEEELFIRDYLAQAPSVAVKSTERDADSVRGAGHRLNS